jgi:hypothetical protein
VDGEADADLVLKGLDEENPRAAEMGLNRTLLRASVLYEMLKMLPGSTKFKGHYKL